MNDCLGCSFALNLQNINDKFLLKFQFQQNNKNMLDSITLM